MATSAIAGYKASITSKVSTSTAAATTLGELRDYTLSVEMSEIDATSHGSSGWREIIAGIKSWNFDAEALYVDDNATQDQLRDALSGDTKLTVTFIPITGDKKWQGSAYVTSWDLSGPTEDAAATSISGMGTGALSTAA